MTVLVWRKVKDKLGWDKTPISCRRGIVDGEWVAGHVYGYNDGSFRVTGTTLEGEKQPSLFAAKRIIQNQYFLTRHGWNSP